MSWHSYSSKEKLDHWAEIYVERGDEVSIQQNRSAITVYDHRKGKRVVEGLKTQMKVY